MCKKATTLLTFSVLTNWRVHNPQHIASTSYCPYPLIALRKSSPGSRSCCINALQDIMTTDRSRDQSPPVFHYCDYVSARTAQIKATTLSRLCSGFYGAFRSFFPAVFPDWNMIFIVRLVFCGIYREINRNNSLGACYLFHL